MNAILTIKMPSIYDLKNKEIIKLVESLKRQPEVVEAKKQAYHERQAFIRKVFGEACEKAFKGKPLHRQ